MNEQVQSVLKQLSIIQRIGIIFAAVALGGGDRRSWSCSPASPTTPPAFTEAVRRRRQLAHRSALRTANIPYQLTDAGTTIEVPVDSLGDARIAAADAGVTVATAAPRAWTSSTTSSSGPRSSTSR